MNSKTAPTVSVIIPTLNEAGRLGATLKALRGEPAEQILIVDGGSSDSTASLARMHPDARVLPASPGRARQLNAGAAAATAEVLLFLHADTRLPGGGLTCLRQAMSEQRLIGGAFRMRLDSRRRKLRAVARAVNWRSRWLSWPYGDQGLFVRQTVFEQIGGYRDLPMMEDLDLIVRLKGIGRLTLLPEAVTTSARQWRAHGVARTTAANWTAALAYRMGADPHRIHRWHQRRLPPGEEGGPQQGEGKR